jgi:hypothetical protein
VHYNSSLLFRSADMKTRIQVEFGASGDVERPYRIAFHNIAHGDRGGARAVELKHSDTGFIWIEGISVSFIN